MHNSTYDYPHTHHGIKKGIEFFLADITMARDKILDLRYEFYNFIIDRCIKGKNDWTTSSMRATEK